MQRAWIVPLFIIATALVVDTLLMYGYEGGWCDATEIEVLSGLAGDRQIVSYIQNCGATTDYTANVSFYSPGDSIGKPGSVFFADHANGVKLERVSPDTVKVIFAATRVIRTKEEDGGIVFLYEEDWRAF